MNIENFKEIIEKRNELQQDKNQIEIEMERLQAEIVLEVARNFSHCISINYRKLFLAMNK